MPASAGARTLRALDTLHAALYFAPDADEVYAEVGLRPGRMHYFASRAAAMGAVGPGVVAATFYNFNPELVERYVPRAWTLADPDAVLEARLRLADRTLRRLLGDDVDTDPDVAEARDLALAALKDLPVAGRPLFAGHAAQPVPEPPHLALWHAITVLREFRGDGHVAALVGSGLSGLEALVLHVATGRSFTVPAAQATRGWTDTQWTDAHDTLAARGLVDADGITASGLALRADLETATDHADAQPWRTLGPDRTARLGELGTQFATAAVGAGAFPAGVFAAR